MEEIINCPEIAEYIVRYTDVYDLENLFLSNSVFIRSVQGDALRKSWVRKVENRSGDYWDIFHMLGEKVHGSYKRYHKGVLFKELNYHNGRLHGIQRIWRENHIWSRKEYYHGLQWGLFRTWDRGGNLESEGFYRRGKLRGKYRTYVDGILRSESHYKKDKLHGLSITFCEDLKVEDHYHKGEKHGICRRWQGGELIEESEYQKGVMKSKKIWQDSVMTCKIVCGENRRVEETYHRCGTVESRLCIVGGKKKVLRRFYSNGKLKELARSKWGNRRGYQGTWNTDGNPIKEEFLCGEL